MLMNATTSTSPADSPHRAVCRRSRTTFILSPLVLNLIGCGTTCGPISIGYEFEAMYVDGADTTDIAAELSERQLWTGTADYQKDIDAVSLFTARLGLDGEPTDWSSVPILESADLESADLKERAPNHAVGFSAFALATMFTSGCAQKCPDLRAPDTAAYEVVNADEYPAETGTMVDREDLHGAWIIEEGDSLRVLYHRPTGEGVEVTYRRLPEEETGP